MDICKRTLALGHSYCARNRYVALVVKGINTGSHINTIDFQHPGSGVISQGVSHLGHGGYATCVMEGVHPCQTYSGRIGPSIKVVPCHVSHARRGLYGPRVGEGGNGPLVQLYRRAISTGIPRGSLSRCSRGGEPPTRGILEGEGIRTILGIYTNGTGALIIPLGIQGRLGPTVHIAGLARRNSDQHFVGRTGSQDHPPAKEKGKQEQRYPTPHLPMILHLLTLPLFLLISFHFFNC